MELLLRTFAHSIWQGAVIALLLAGGLAIIPARKAQLRYLLCIAGLVGIVITGSVHFSLMQAASLSHSAPTPPLFPPAPSAVNTASHSAALSSPALPPAKETAAPITGPSISKALPHPSPAATNATLLRTLWAMWGLGALFFLTRTALSYRGAQALRHRATPWQPIPPILHETIRALGMGAQRIEILLTDQLTSPAVVGIIRPAILLPASLVTGLPEELLRAIFAHELAHIRRWDSLVNLGQMIVESLLFFNPFVWWISHQIRRERESCCDQIAATVCGSKTRYLEALLACTTPSNPTNPTATLAADGHERSLLDRAQRLLSPGYRPAMLMRGRTFVAALLLMAALFILLALASRFTVKMLTPAERIQKIEEIQKEYNIPVATAATPQSFTIQGEISTADGGLIDFKEVSIIAETFTPSLITQLSPRLKERGHRPSGSFSFDTDAPTYSIAAWVKGYLPAYLDNQSSNTTPHPKLVLQKAPDAILQIIDPAGHPLEGVELTIQYPGNEQHITIGTIQLKTDHQGKATIPASALSVLTLTATKDGYQKLILKEWRLTSTPVSTFTLRPATAVTIRVLSAETGKPIPSAQIQLALSKQEGLFSNLEHARTIATTDSTGSAVLTSLNDDDEYRFFVIAEGYAPTYTPAVNTSTKALEYQLNRPITITGKILFFHPESDPKSIKITALQTIFSHNVGFQRSTPTTAKVENGVAHFHLTNLFALPVEIKIADLRHLIDPLQHSIADLTFDYHPAGKTPHIAIPKRIERDVTIHFKPPQGMPPASGQVTVRYSRSRNMQGYQESDSSKPHPIIDSKVTLKIPVPNNITMESKGMIGYSPKTTSFDIPEGTTPYEVSVEMAPAGALYGEVMEEDGQPVNGVMISIYPVGKLPSYSSSLSINSTIVNGHSPNQFVGTPLTLGEKYAIIANRDMTYVFTPYFHITDKDPIQHTQIIIPKGKDVTIRLLDPFGKPTVMQGWVNFDYTSPWGNRYGSSLPRDKEIVLHNVNFQSKSIYKVDLKPTANYLPTSIILDPKKSLYEVRLQQGKRLTGTIIDLKTGHPISNIEVTARAANPNYSDPTGKTPDYTRYPAEATTDAAGRFQFSNLPDTPVLLSSGKMESTTKEAPVTPGQTEEVILKTTPWPNSDAVVVTPTAEEKAPSTTPRSP